MPMIDFGDSSVEEERMKRFLAHIEIAKPHRPTIINYS